MQINFAFHFFLKFWSDTFATSVADHPQKETESIRAFPQCSFKSIPPRNTASITRLTTPSTPSQYFSRVGLPRFAVFCVLSNMLSFDQSSEDNRKLPLIDLELVSDNKTQFDLTRLLLRGVQIDFENVLSSA